MADKIAATTFETGPTDSVAVADVYQNKPTAPVNNQPTNAVKDSAIAAAQALRRNTNFKDLAELITIEDGKASVKPKDAADKVADVIGGPNSPLADLTENIKDSLLKAVGFADENELAAAAEGSGGNVVKTKKGWQTVQGIKVIYNNVVALRNFDPKNAGDVAKLLNGIAGNSELAKVLDLESQFAVLGSVMKKVSELGIPDAIDMILDKLADDKERRRLILENLRQFVMNSDIYTLGKAYQYVGGPGILSRVPDFINLLMTFYRLPFGTSKPTLTILNQVKGLMDNVQPNWHKYNRNGVLINNLEPFSYASQDALNLFALDPNFIIHVRVAPARINAPYRNREIIGLVIDSFPGINLDGPDIYKNVR